ncbi:microtubule-associated protein Jupiter-like [Argiope bruennichi]|uniref:microtubule-associated protein Jupiter-like n=1 Tax=Argiope bruennichi TaxID=94029 RepID=UPI0024946AD3|nr:microtubule-associated protein Jupiter-like [Argiope bruennichi]
MAPVYDFRHVELDKIGRGKRIVKPPGGECSDIFSPGRTAADQITPRKTKNYMQSTIFSPDSPQNGHSHSPTTPSKLLDTQSRLFGSDSEEHTPRRVVNRQRSSIFEDEVDSKPHVQKTTPVRRPVINPITGEPFLENGTPNGSSNGGTPNGSSNGGTPTNGHSNGYTNGHSSPMNGDSPMNGEVRRNRIPPGGKSSGIF